MEQQPVNSSRNDTKRRPRRESQRRCGPSLWSIFIVTCVIFCTVMFRMSWELTTNNNNSNSIDGTSSNNKLSMLNNFAGTVRPAKVVLAKDAKEDSLRKSTLKQSILDAKIESERQLTLDNKNNDNHHGSEPPPLNRLIDRSIRVEVPDKERTLAFVHIGKSGGSTISLLLRNGCMTSVDGIACEEHRWEKFPGPAGETETIASQRIQFYLHTPHAESGKLAEYYNRITSVVVVARDPLERFVSAFLCRHPKNIDATRLRNKRARNEAFSRGKPEPIWAKVIWGNKSPEENEEQRAAFTGCYPNMEEFAFCADQHPIGNHVYNTTISWSDRYKIVSRGVSFVCKEVCRDIALQKSEFVHHARWGYQSFLQPLQPSKEVFVIRTKKLWEDWVVVNNMLGSKYDVAVPDKESEAHVVNARGALPVSSNLSDAGRKIICQFLVDEIRIYIDLLNRATNLSDDDVLSSLEGLNNNCPDVMESLAANKLE